MSRWPEEDCRQCLDFEKRDRGPAHLDVEEQLGKDDVYSWNHGNFWSKTQSDTVNVFQANPTLYRNAKELCRLQETLLGTVADVFQAKKEDPRPTEEQQRQGYVEYQYLLLLLGFSQGQSRWPFHHIACSRQERERAIRPHTLWRKLNWDTYTQAHAWASHMFRCLQLRWYWPNSPVLAPGCQPPPHNLPTPLSNIPSPPPGLHIAFFNPLILPPPLHQLSQSCPHEDDVRWLSKMTAAVWGEYVLILEENKLVGRCGW